MLFLTKRQKRSPMIKTKKQLRVSENVRERRLKMCMVNK